MTKAMSNLEGMRDSVVGAASGAVETVRSAADAVGANVRRAAEGAYGSVENAANYFGEIADDATSAAGRQIKSAGKAIRHNGPHHGYWGKTSRSIGRSVAQTGRYVERRGLEGVACALTHAIRRNPLPALAISLGLTYFVLRSLSRRT